MSLAPTINCGQCGKALPSQLWNTGQLAACPHCADQQQVEVFPALYRKAQATAGEALLVEGESSCFYHPQKRAAVACENCGRFLCALCEVEFAGRRLCPACIESGKSKKKIKNLETQRFLYDDLALALTILPIILGFFPTIVTAPIALFISIRHWNSPTSVLPRTRIRFVLAILIALAEIAGWTLFAYFSFFKGRGH